MHKQNARTLRTALKAVTGIEISHMDALEVTARLAGKRDWHQLSRETRDQPQRPSPVVPPHQDHHRAAWNDELRDLTRHLDVTDVPAEYFDQAYRDDLSPDQVAAELTLDGAGVTVTLTDLGKPDGGVDAPGHPDVLRLDVAVGADPDVRDARVSLLTALPVTVHPAVQRAHLDAVKKTVLSAVAAGTSVRRACERAAASTPQDVIVQAVIAQSLTLLHAPAPGPSPTSSAALTRLAALARDLNVPAEALAQETRDLHAQLAAAHTTLRMQLTFLLGESAPFVHATDDTVPADDRLRPLVALRYQRLADAVNAQGRDAQLAFLLDAWGSEADARAALRALN
ncbi:glyoxalase superfamily protein [Deinococcus soli (ex Cha et al. 2016)]|uniref:Uncharacterized protein YlxW (UPF0749 family) n=2 Tax=Deinococcus soli (ex Cha et al. 2016) TaxID=1309411 RepID=A0ACC6KH84_9DEIO|nr:glyoxalase superfamily protein [Deinococcus soli (ex Cha et al. 2016)]MDR6218850.1 uncharacterized protein YlxW (UPF0749 family) [Deinococcus soli (ex Cha et al. 2016)]MDR6328647.1 uncharacterized protein YlxW (UPF0749 family) [Deinococcus soli (ex Cha et al. 2016)]MDR6751866.1 uncharacterized protein YlxW (UPF0749 family) [Deinococcus soli (ex Cha et al. 2016)]